MLTLKDIEDLNSRLMHSRPQEILATVCNEFPRCAISFSGAEDVLLIEMARKLQPKPAVFTLDTGRLHPETYQFIEKVREHYQLDIDILYPDAQRLQELVQAKGLFSFFQDGHEECCGIRKVEPLRKKLAELDVWITGQRRDQSPTRVEVAVIELDRTFSTDSHQVVKVNPLANWTSEDVWNHIRMLEVPYNELHDRGFTSIGCEPCTRAVGPGQHEREGRWWWEEATIKECGLHVGNVREKSSD